MASEIAHLVAPKFSNPDTSRDPQVSAFIIAHDIVLRDIQAFPTLFSRKKMKRSDPPVVAFILLKLERASTTSSSLIFANQNFANQK